MAHLFSGETGSVHKLQSRAPAALHSLALVGVDPVRSSRVRPSWIDFAKMAAQAGTEWQRTYWPLPMRGDIVVNAAAMEADTGMLPSACATPIETDSTPFCR